MKTPKLKRVKPLRRHSSFVSLVSEGSLVEVGSDNSTLSETAEVGLSLVENLHLLQLRHRKGGHPTESYIK